MKNTIVGGLVGGCILFIWGAIAWTVLPLHQPSIRAIPDETAVMDAMRNSMKEKGMYEFPAMPEDQSDAAAQSAWEEKYRRGPVGMISYDPLGGDPMMPATFATGFVISFLSAAIAAWFLARSTASAGPYLSRVLFCGMLGIFISFGSHLLSWNWMNYPTDHTTAMVADTINGWLLAGLGIGAIVKSPVQS